MNTTSSGAPFKSPLSNPGKSRKRVKKQTKPITPSPVKIDPTSTSDSDFYNPPEFKETDYKEDRVHSV